MRAVQRNSAIEILNSFKNQYVTAILGPRRVGKSTLVEQYIQQNTGYEWATFNMDEHASRQAIENGELRKLIEGKILRKISADKTTHVFIDEAQKAPSLFDQIKSIYDEFKGQKAIKFILTGSAQLALHQLSAESLAGRIEIFQLQEFTTKELSELTTGKRPETGILELLCEGAPVSNIEECIQALSPFESSQRTLINEQIVWGGLPEVYESDDEQSRLRYLANYLQTYLEKDIRAIETISDINLYERLLEIIAEQTGSIRDDTKLVQALGCSRDTLKKYRGYLLATLVYQDIEPFIESSLKRVVKSPKGYLLNNGLISYLTGIHKLDILEKTGQIGHRFENWFLNELQVVLANSPKRSHIRFWRNTSGAEVDFVAHIKPNAIPFEVTYSQQIDKKKIRNLKKLMNDNPQIERGICVYNGEFYANEASNILFVPAWCL